MMRNASPGSKFLLQHDAAPVGQQIEQCVLATEFPEQRYREPEPVVLGDVHALADVPHVLNQCVMLKLNPLWRGGRARCVKQVSDIFRVDGKRRVLDLGIRHGASTRIDLVERNRVAVRARANVNNELKPWRGMSKRLDLIEHREIVAFEKLVAGDEHPRVRMGEDVAELAACDPSIDRDHDGAEGADRKVRYDPLGFVAHQYRD